MEARELTRRIKEATTNLYDMLREAHDRRAWKAMGYDTWREYIEAEFDFGVQYAYRLVSQSRVIRSLGEAASDSKQALTERRQLATPVNITESAARRIAPHLEEAKAQIRTEVEAGVEPQEAIARR